MFKEKKIRLFCQTWNWSHWSIVAIQQKYTRWCLFIIYIFSIITGICWGSTDIKTRNRSNPNFFLRGQGIASDLLGKREMILGHASSKPRQMILRVEEHAHIPHIIDADKWTNGQEKILPITTLYKTYGIASIRYKILLNAL